MAINFSCTAALLTLGQLAGFAAFAARTVASPASLFGKLPPKCIVAIQGLAYPQFYKTNKKCEITIQNKIN